LKQEKKYPIINVKIYIVFVGLNTRTYCVEKKKKKKKKKKRLRKVGGKIRQSE